MAAAGVCAVFKRISVECCGRFHSTLRVFSIKCSVKRGFPLFFVNCFFVSLLF